MRLLKSFFAKDESPRLDAVGSAGGLPVPSSYLVELVTGQRSLDVFLESGELGVRAIEEMLGRSGLELASLGSVLDFGCGCGRVLRFLQEMKSVSLHGTDISRDAILWADENLNFAEFCTNRLAPPLRYRDGSFDLVYAFSVFTHLPEDLQGGWLRELGRTLRKGGHFILSTHGEHYVSHLNAEEEAKYRAGELVVRHSTKAGANECAVFHPESYVRERLAVENGFEVVDFVAEGALGNPKQDLYLLRK